MVLNSLYWHILVLFKDQYQMNSRQSLTAAKHLEKSFLRLLLLRYIHPLLLFLATRCHEIAYFTFICVQTGMRMVFTFEFLNIYLFFWIDDGTDVVDVGRVFHLDALFLFEGTDGVHRILIVFGKRTGRRQSILCFNPAHLMQVVVDFVQNEFILFFLDQMGTVLWHFQSETELILPKGADYIESGVLAVVLLTTHHLFNRNEEYVLEKGRFVHDVADLLVGMLVNYKTVYFLSKTLEELGGLYALVGSYGGEQGRFVKYGLQFVKVLLIFETVALEDLDQEGKHDDSELLVFFVGGMIEDELVFYLFLQSSSGVPLEYLQLGRSN